MEEDQIRSAVLDAFEVSLDAQLRAVLREREAVEEAWLALAEES